MFLLTNEDVSGATRSHAVPFHTLIALVLLLKYRAPVRSALPSLSTLGADDLGPRYLSSNESYEAAALVALVAAFDALVDAALAEDAAFVACVVAVDADAAALVADVLALEAEVLAAEADEAALVA